MSILVRRSNLLVPLTDDRSVADVWRHNADAITLDLAGMDSERKTDANAIQAAIASAGKGGAEVFVRIEKKTLADDLRAAVHPGIRGIVLPHVDAALDVEHADALVASLEREREMQGGSLTFIVLLSSPRAVWDMRSILKASTRISQAGLDEIGLAASLGFVPDPDYDPFLYARGRLAVEATATKVAAIGMAYPMSVTQPADAPASEIHAMATKGRNLGMKGVLCPHATWVAPVNDAYTPTPELVEWNRRVRAAFAEGVAAGTAAVPLDGKMIDVPVDEWAIVVLAMSEACAARDAEKNAAPARAG
jgi:citrate lyase subunit beta / citryl-CoA lyase